MRRAPMGVELRSDARADEAMDWRTAASMAVVRALRSVLAQVQVLTGSDRHNDVVYCTKLSPSTLRKVPLQSKSRHKDKPHRRLERILPCELLVQQAFQHLVSWNVHTRRARSKNTQMSQRRRRWVEECWVRVVRFMSEYRKVWSHAPSLTVPVLGWNVRLRCVYWQRRWLKKLWWLLPRPNDGVDRTKIGVRE